MPALALITTLAALLVLPVDGPGSVTALGTAAALALATGLLLRAPRTVLPVPRAVRAPGAPAEDERCRRGSFRRQTSPDAPGRPRPRAPQAA